MISVFVHLFPLGAFFKTAPLQSKKEHYGRVLWNRLYKKQLAEVRKQQDVLFQCAAKLDEIAARHNKSNEEIDKMEKVLAKYSLVQKQLATKYHLPKKQ